MYSIYFSDDGILVVQQITQAELERALEHPEENPEPELVLRAALEAEGFQFVPYEV